MFDLVSLDVKSGVGLGIVIMGVWAMAFMMGIFNTKEKPLI